MLYICIVSNKFDLKQTIRVLHITIFSIKVLFAILKAVLLSVAFCIVILSGVVLSVVMLSVMAPLIVRSKVSSPESLAWYEVGFLVQNQKNLICL